VRHITRSKLAIIRKREAEPWIYSYADLVTNLLAFFMMLLIVMTSSAAVRQDFVEGIKNYVATKGFSAKGELGEGAGSLGSAGAGAGGATGSAASAGAPATVEDVRRITEQIIQEEGLGSQVSLKETLTGIDLAFAGAMVFDTGTAVIRPEAEQVLEQISVVIAKLPPRFVLDVEGHADIRPITSASPYPSNWELSTARAGSVVRFLEGHGLSSRRLRAIGYGATRLADKDHPDAESNRRVVVKINSQWEGEQGE
jgi:chemotaxis protein MotB